MNQLVTAMHDITHLVPGVPAHSDGPAGQQSRQTPANRRVKGPQRHNHSRQHQKPPRVLVGWQNWIAGLGRRR